MSAPISHWARMYHAVENSKAIAHAALCTLIHSPEVPPVMRSLIHALHESTHDAAAALEAHRAEEDAAELAKYNRRRRAKRTRKAK